ncbi:hypothetical protein FB45DRAFT_900525 [Roridomyces roridus]|uniref:Uncharacterized protein n=1 Tax=Roridomyces roridus TaxID=1738132 RepID=A0AAD7FT68_9AGAR|nr:hypothetical protein FB45DRAFT_900525 [Roridomyces roridus]
MPPLLALKQRSLALQPLRDVSTSSARLVGIVLPILYQARTPGCIVLCHTIRPPPDARAAKFSHLSRFQHGTPRNPRASAPIPPCAAAISPSTRQYQLRKPSSCSPLPTSPSTLTRSAPHIHTHCFLSYEWTVSAMWDATVQNQQRVSSVLSNARADCRVRAGGDARSRGIGRVGASVHGGR